MSFESRAVLIQQYKDTINWLRSNNENGHHDKNIARREKDLERLENGGEE